MDDLIAFVTARLDEEEAAAKAARSEWSAEWVVMEFQDLPDDVFDHMRLYSPARVLREVAAKRAIMAAYEAVAYMDIADPEPEFAYGRAVGLGEAVRQLAAIWSDHPDYRAEWAPEGAPD